MDRLTNRGTNGEIWITDNDATRAEGRQKAAYEELAMYEDMEEALESVFGDCPGLLKKVIDTLKSPPNIEETPVKSRLLTDEDADKWLEYKQLEEQGRLLKLPCKIGDIVYIIEDDCEGDPACCYHTCDVCNQRNLHIEELTFNIEYIEDLGEYIFLTKSEAEAKVNELKKHK